MNAVVENELCYISVGGLVLLRDDDVSDAFPFTEHALRSSAGILVASAASVWVMSHPRQCHDSSDHVDTMPRPCHGRDVSDHVDAMPRSGHCRDGSDHGDTRRRSHHDRDPCDHMDTMRRSRHDRGRSGSSAGSTRVGLQRKRARTRHGSQAPLRGYCIVSEHRSAKEEMCLTALELTKAFGLRRSAGRGSLTLSTRIEA